MTRTVKVELQADVASYLSGVLEADKATNKLDNKVEALDRDLNKLPADATKAGAALGVMGAEAKKAGNDVDELGKKTRAGGDEAGKFKGRIAELEGSLKSLASEFDRTGDPSLLKKFKADSSELAGLKKMAKGLEDVAGDVENLGKKAAGAAEKTQSLFGSLQAGFEGGLTSPGGLGIAGIAAVPALATAGGAALAGIGAIGAGAGVASAVMGDPNKFQSAWNDAIGTVQEDFLQAGRAFTGPTMAAINSIGPTIHSWNLSAALAPAAKYVPILVDGLERGATGLEHGIADSIAKAGPAVQALSQGLAQLGSAAGDALSHIADGSEGGAQALHDTIAAVSALVEGFGLLTEGAEKAYKALNDHPFLAAGLTGGLSLAATAWDKVFGDVDEGGKALGQTLPGVQTSIDETGHSALAAADDFKALGKQLAAADQTMDKFVGGKVVEALDTMMSLDRATLGFNVSLTSLSDTLKTNGRSLDEHTAKGQANVGAILSAVQANIQTYQSNIAAKMGAEQAAAAYDVNTQALERQLRAAHFTQGQIDGLIGKYRSVPDQVNTDIVLHGLETAIRDLNTTLKLINGIKDKNVIVSVTTVYHSKGGPVVGEGGTIPLHGAYAEGTDSAAAGLSLVGEHGPELVQMRGGERVFTASTTRAMMATSSSWGASSAGPMAIALTLAAAPGADTAVGSFVNGLIRNGYVVVKASQVRAG